MKSFFLTFRSITPAQRAERAFARVGIAVVLRRTPRWMEEQGCGYCLGIKCRELDTALDLLRKNHVTFRKVYRRTEGEELQEVAL